ncbi:MAG: hypothetical protein OXJ54_00375 [Gemmatimonadetes bacterium]|nr:hypothetical protein [Candidatus Palauibacter rhopaloidicola]
MSGRKPRGGRPAAGATDPTAGDGQDPARMDRIALPRLNPWLALLILVLLGFGYIGLWGRLLGG